MICPRCDIKRDVEIEMLKHSRFVLYCPACGYDVDLEDDYRAEQATTWRDE